MKTGNQVFLFQIQVIIVINSLWGTPYQALLLSDVYLDRSTNPLGTERLNSLHKVTKLGSGWTRI